MECSINWRTAVIGATCPRTCLIQPCSGTTSNGVQRGVRWWVHCMHRCGNVSKKPKWTRLLIIDSQAVKNTCHASIRRKDFVTTNAPMASSAISRSIRWDYHFTHCTKANITDDQGLIELLSHNLDYFREASQHSKSLFCSTMVIIPIPFRKHYKLSIRKWWAKIRPACSEANKSRRAAQGKTGFVPWRHDGSLNGRMLGWRWWKLSQNFERTLSHATAKVNLCFVRLMLKRLSNDWDPKWF